VVVVVGDVVGCSATRHDMDGGQDGGGVLAREREAFCTERLQWQTDKRELCGRIADLELEVSNLITASSNALACSGSLEEEPQPSLDSRTGEGTSGDFESHVVIGGCNVVQCTQGEVLTSSSSHRQRV
jgi:hypothetical protein